MVIQTFEIKKENIDLFVSPEWQRQIRESKISKFKKTILENNFMSSLITCNLKDGKYRLINGNHRIKAIKEVIGKVEKVVVVLDVHKDLSQKEEKELFSKISIETPQTLDDYLYIFRTDIPKFKELTEDMPVQIRVYSDGHAIKLSTILKIFKSVRNKQLEADFRSIDRHEHLEIAKTITDQEIAYLKKFFELFKEVVGITKENYLYKPLLLIPLVDIFGRYETNLFGKKAGKQSPSNAWDEDAWKKLFRAIKSDPILLQYVDMNTSREKMREVRDRILYLSQHGKLVRSGGSSLV